ncbi:hypothetical protein [Arthrobacter sp. NA-172]|uniref:hypothetical protein n=1 Tax=Arthrobacter sp. NA-172 TaxID=3367524 RepID=UPI0037544D45
MASFTLDGSRTCMRTPPGDPDSTRSWVYGHYPKVRATITHTTGTVYAHAERWNRTHVQARWEDDDRRPQ